MRSFLQGHLGSLEVSVKNRRIKVGVSQRELAKDGEVSYRTIIRLEKGGKIREKMLQKILKALKRLELSGREPSDWWKWHRKGIF